MPRFDVVVKFTQIFGAQVSKQKLCCLIALLLQFNGTNGVKMAHIAIKSRCLKDEEVTLGTFFCFINIVILCSRSDFEFESA